MVEDPASQVRHPVGQGLHNPSVPPEPAVAKYQPAEQAVTVAAVVVVPAVIVATEQSSESLVETNVVHATQTPVDKV